MDQSLSGSLLILTLAAAASPFSLVCFALVLASDRGPRNGLAFIAGWITTVFIIGLAVSLVGTQVNLGVGEWAGKVTLALELALGVVLLLLWLRRRMHPEYLAEGTAPKDPPTWERKLSELKPISAFIAGGVVQTWPVMLAGAAEIARRRYNLETALIYVAVFAIATSAGLWVLETLALRNPAGAQHRLDVIRTTIQKHRNSVLNWVYLLGGLWLVFSGAFGLFK